MSPVPTFLAHWPPLDDFDDFNPAGPVDSDAFEHYLVQPVEWLCTMPLNFWHIRQELGVVLRALAQMAKDFLSCPGVYPALGCMFHPLICLQLCWLMLNESSHFLARLSIPSRL